MVSPDFLTLQHVSIPGLGKGSFRCVGSMFAQLGWAVFVQCGRDSKGAMYKIVVRKQKEA